MNKTSGLEFEYVSLKYFIDYLNKEKEIITASYSKFFKESISQLHGDNISLVSKGNLLSSFDSIKEGETAKIKDTRGEFIMRGTDGVYVNFSAYTKKVYASPKSDDELIASGYYKNSSLNKSEMQALVKPFLKENKISQKKFFSESFQAQREKLESMGCDIYKELSQCYEVYYKKDFTLKRKSKEEKESVIQKSEYSTLYSNLTSSSFTSTQSKLALIKQLLNDLEYKMESIDIDDIVEYYQQQQQQEMEFFNSPSIKEEFVLNENSPLIEGYYKKKLDEKLIPREEKEFLKEEIIVRIGSASSNMTSIVSSIDVENLFKGASNNISKGMK